MGLGFFMLEEYENNLDGLILADGTWNYKIPTIDTIPKQFNVEILNSEHHQHRVLSSKGKDTGFVPYFLEILSLDQGLPVYLFLPINAYYLKLGGLRILFCLFTVVVLCFGSAMKYILRHKNEILLSLIRRKKIYQIEKEMKNRETK